MLGDFRKSVLVAGPAGVPGCGGLVPWAAELNTPCFWKPFLCCQVRVSCLSVHLPWLEERRSSSRRKRDLLSSLAFVLQTNKSSALHSQTVSLPLQGLPSLSCENRRLQIKQGGDLVIDNALGQIKEQGSTRAVPSTGCTSGRSWACCLAGAGGTCSCEGSQGASVLLVSLPLWQKGFSWQEGWGATCRGPAGMRGRKREPLGWWCKSSLRAEHCPACTAPA